MSLTAWMKEFDDATNAWFAQLEAEKDHDKYLELFNEQPSIDPYLSETGYEEDIAPVLRNLEEENERGGYYKITRHYYTYIYRAKQQFFTLRVLQEAFGADNVEHTPFHEWEDGNYGVTLKDSKYTIWLNFNAYDTPYAVAFVECGDDHFYTTAEFINFITEHSV